MSYYCLCHRLTGLLQGCHDIAYCIPDYSVYLITEVEITYLKLTSYTFKTFYYLILFILFTSIGTQDLTLVRTLFLGGYSYIGYQYR
jgi:hypothetical protein